MSQPRDAIEALYREVVLDHYRHPRHRDPLPDPTGSATVDNPVCGDQVRVQVRTAAKQLEAVAAQTRGCSIAVAAGSVMTEVAPGHTLDRIVELRSAVESLIEGGEPDSSLDRRLRAFAGVARFPARRRCALLPWEALEAALRQA